jgi:hypothetical protein
MDPTEHIVPSGIEKPVPVLFWGAFDLGRDERRPQLPWSR